MKVPGIAIVVSTLRTVPGAIDKRLGEVEIRI